MLATQSPFPQYFDKDGKPLDNGMLYFGQVNQNPETAPITVYWDAAGTQPAAQPIRTMNGYTYRAGSPAQVYANSDYSITVRDKQGRVIVTSPNSSEFSLSSAISTIYADLADIASTTKGDALIGVKLNATGAVARTQHDKNAERVSVFDFGAKGDGVTDDTAAIQAAITYAQSNMVVGTTTSPAMGAQEVFFPDGYYKITSALVITKAISLVGAKSSEFATGARLLQTNPNADLLQFNPGTNGGVSFSVERLTMVGTVAGTGHFINVKKGTPGYNSWRVIDCCFVQPASLAILALGDDIQIIGNTFDVSTNSGNAIQLGTTTAGETASNVIISGNNFFNIGTHCVQFVNCQGVSVVSNRVTQPNSGTYTASVFDALDITPTLAAGISIDGNYIYGGRRIFAGNGVSSVALTGNLTQNCGLGAGEIYDAITLSGTCSAVSILANNFKGTYGTKSIFFNAGSLTDTAIVGNSISGSSTGTALVCGSMTGHVGLTNNISGWATKISALDLGALGYFPTGFATLSTTGGTVTPDASLADNFLVFVTGAGAITVAAPLNPSNGRTLTITVLNNSGGAMGAVTFASGAGNYKNNAFTAPGNGLSHSITFKYNAALQLWYEVSRTATAV